MEKLFSSFQCHDCDLGQCLNLTADYHERFGAIYQTVNQATTLLLTAVVVCYPLE